MGMPIGRACKLAPLSLGRSARTVSGNEAIVVQARSQRKAGSRRLGNPPESAHPGVAAGHHPMAKEIHHCGADLRGRVNCI